ncbi:hypothetical protein J4234_06280 [Candidatus Woesearchaeota archaeon]|nr:hypothetical protein [Candidatus Woesearchaeota archaeon]
MDKKNEHKNFVEIEPKLIKKLLNMPKPIAMNILKRINYKMHLQKDNILKQALEENFLTEEEYNEKYKDMFYDEFGSDSFIQYINAVMNAKIDVFLTENERMLKRKEELQKRFGLGINSPEDILKKLD